MSAKIAVLIDGGFLRVKAKAAQLTYDPDFIETFGKRCRLAPEELLRILYYDCPPFTGSATLPISGAPKQFNGSDAWLLELAQRELLAVRKGSLKFRGYQRKSQVVGAATQDSDFEPKFQQKGVDLSIGLDIANLTATRSVERIALVTNDIDLVPAMKLARRGGLQVVLIEPGGSKSAAELRMHADFRRAIALREPAAECEAAR